MARGLATAAFYGSINRRADPARDAPDCRFSSRINYTIMMPDWRHRDDYIRTRAQRKGNLGEVNIDPTWANEAYADIDAVRFPDPASRTGRGVRTVGWSGAAGMLITVITIDEGGRVWGANAWKSSRSDREIYRKGMANEY